VLLCRVRRRQPPDGATAVTAVVPARAPCGADEYPYWRAVKLHLIHTVERMPASRTSRHRNVKTQPLTIIKVSEFTGAVQRDKTVSAGRT
jgi:hypothetical protein